MVVECPAFEISDTERVVFSQERRYSADTYDSSSGCSSTANGWRNCDGADDESTATTETALSTRSVGPSLTTNRSSARSAPPLKPTKLSVADRIKAFDQRPTPSPSSPKRQRDDTGAVADAPRQLLRTSTKLSKRMSPFVRHGGDISLISPPAPPESLHVSQQAPKIHSPVPQRHPSILLRSPDIPRPSEVFASEWERPSTRPNFVRGNPTQPEVAAAGQALPLPAFPSASHTCTRHGRTLRPKKRGGPTVDGIERSRSGAYIPSGHRLRHQVPATSPWYHRDQNLTKTEGTTLSPEPCPDCMSEEMIRCREDAELIGHESIIAANEQGPGFSAVEVSSTATEPGTPVEESLTGPTVIGTAIDHQAVLLPGSAAPGTFEADSASIVAADLGDMIDAIIIEHRGTLNRVITNLRDGAPNMDTFQQMSKDIAKVSTSLSAMKTEKVDILEDKRSRYSFILDSPPEFLKTRTKSIPDLIDFIDSAAKDLGVALPRSDKQSNETSQLSVQPAAPSPVEEAAGVAPDNSTRPLDQAARTLRDRAALKSLAPPQPQSAYATANPTPAVTPQPRAESPLILAVNVPEAMARSMPVPMIGSTGTMNMDFVNPSQRAAASSGGVAFTASPVAAAGPSMSGGIGALPALASTAFGGTMPAGTIGASRTAAESLHTDGSSEPRTPISRIPTPSYLEAVPRRHVPGTDVDDHSTWRRPCLNIGSKPAEAASKRPKQLQRSSEKGQGTFTQPFVRELARDASMKERAGRRSLFERRASKSIPT